METKKSKKNADVPTEPIGPVRVFRIEDISVSVFARDRMLQGVPVTFYSVSFSRSYKGADGQRKYTKTFDADNLGALVSLSQQASEFIRGRQPSQAA
jgi:hypothetical protein